jgi:hypothetical protein
MANKYVKFTGNFSDLIPDGWHFQKLFARNYRQYHKTCDGEKYSQGCRIWQHLGGYLEIDLGLPVEVSYLVVEQIRNGRISEWASICRGFAGDEEIVFWLKYDVKENTFYPYHSDKYKNIRRMELELSDKHTSKEHFSRYHTCNLGAKLVDMIRDLLNKGWIEVVEDKRK